MKITRSLLQSLEFRAFTKTDYYGFCDVQSPVPLIAEDESRGICVVIDGDYAELYTFDVDGTFDCVDQCDSIRALPTIDETNRRIEQLKKELADLGA